ncbi:putative leucine-rich repeat domain superfamily [Helianthus annuus]|nr:putative leucine-rich repeat domain superfamily [Helianthus annuus]
MPVACLKFKSLNLSGSKVRNLNLGLTPHLETLNLEDCHYLQEIHAPMYCLQELVYFNISGCSRFICFEVPDWYEIPGLNHLTSLQLFAESIYICPLHSNNTFPKFQFKCFYDEHLPSSSGNLEKLLSFGLCACINLESFSASSCDLQRLGKLTLEGSIPEVPKDLYLLESLKELSLSIKEIRHLPDSICMLKHLKSLKLSYCPLLEQLPKDIGRLESLEELHLTDCISFWGIPDNICPNLKCLNLNGCKVTLTLGRLHVSRG